MRFWTRASSKDGMPVSRHHKEVHAPDPLQLPGKLPMREPTSGGEMQARRQAAQGVVFLFLLVVFGYYGSRLWLSTTETARRKVCRYNLRQLYVGLQMYVQDFDWHYPPAGGELTRQLFPYLEDTRVLTCPSDDLARFTPKKHRRGPVRIPVSYTYSPPAMFNQEGDSDVAQIPVLWDFNGGIPSGAHRKGGNVLYLDGHSRWVPLGFWSAANQPW